MDFRTNPYFNLVVPNLESKNYEQYCGKKKCCKKFKKGKRCKKCPGRDKIS
jgi:hypothetical protein